MPKDIMSLKERAIHLINTSNGFSDYPNTAKWIKYLATTIQQPQATVQEVDYALKELIGAFRVEYIGSDENAQYRAQCYNAYIKLIWGMIGDKGYTVSSDTFESLLPAFETGYEALRNIAEIYQALVASEELSDKRRYFGLCFMYLIHVEGLFDENIRMLYSIKKATEGRKVDYEDIKEKPMGQFKTELDAVFFEGYNNRLRNSIAHARFSFNDDTQKMTFKDIDIRTKSEYSETLTIQEFGVKYYGKIENLSRLHHRYMTLLGVRDLVRIPKPFGETSLLNNKRV